MQHFLGVVAICKNEAHVIDEWLEHYRNEGVTSFLVIDNGSTDDTVARLSTHVDVVVVEDGARHAQASLYNKYANLLSCEWILVVDLDEFLYGSTVPVGEVLRSLPDDVGAVNIPWLCFGSSRHVQQPESVVEGFLWRAAYPADQPPYNAGCKEAVRRRAVDRLELHLHALIGDYRKVDDCLQPFNGTIRISECRVDSAALRLNHYVIQSLAYYRSVKMTRGDAASPGADHVRDDAYFARADKNEVHDDRLLSKRRAK